MLLKKHFLLLSKLKTVVLLNIFVEILIDFFQDSLIKYKPFFFLNRNEMSLLSLDQFDASSLNKISFFKNLTDPKLLSGSVSIFVF